MIKNITAIGEKLKIEETEYGFFLYRRRSTRGGYGTRPPKPNWIFVARCASMEEALAAARAPVKWAVNAGKPHPNARIPAEIVAAIRRDPGNSREVGAKYGVSQPSVYRIRKGQGRRDVESGNAIAGDAA